MDFNARPLDRQMAHIHPSAIVSGNGRYRYLNKMQVGQDSIIDDFCYISTQLSVGRNCHIASHCHISGGEDRTFTLGSFSALSAHTRIICSSNDYESQLLGYFDKPTLGGDVSFGEMTGCGVGCTILWDNHIPEGTVLLAGCIVPPDCVLRPWTMYGPFYHQEKVFVTPIGGIGYRRRFQDQILKQRERVENG